MGSWAALGEDVGSGLQLRCLQEQPCGFPAVTQSGDLGRYNRETDGEISEFCLCSFTINLR